MKPPNDAQWYASAFGALYPKIYAHRSPEAARPESDFAAQCVGLTPEHRALDLCCGAGRHLQRLAQTTPHMTGLDFSPELLNIACRMTPCPVNLVRGDMRRLPFPAVFDVVFNFFTSFGYFSDEENRQSLGELSRVLKGTGRFFMDYLNPEQVRATLVPHSERDAEDCHLVEHRWIDEVQHRVCKSVQVYQGGVPTLQFSESVRMYTVAELMALMRGAGLRVDALYGDYQGNGWASDSPRTIVVGGKGAAHG